MKTTTQQPFKCPVCNGKWESTTYRFLTNNDVFQAGDEVLLSDWRPVVSGMFGVKVTGDFDHYRRPEKVVCKSCTYGIVWGIVTTTYNDWPGPYLPWVPLEPISPYYYTIYCNT